MASPGIERRTLVNRNPQPIASKQDTTVISVVAKTAAGIRSRSYDCAEKLFSKKAYRSDAVMSFSRFFN
jgi:hypothetical protein